MTTAAAAGDHSVQLNFQYHVIMARRDCRGKVYMVNSQLYLTVASTRHTVRYMYTKFSSLLAVQSAFISI